MQTKTTLAEQARRLNEIEEGLERIDAIPLLPAAAKHHLKELGAELVSGMQMQLALMQDIAEALKAEGFGGLDHV